MCSTKVVVMCIVYKLQPNDLLLVLKGGSMHTNPSTSGINS